MQKINQKLLGINLLIILLCFSIIFSNPNNVNNSSQHLDAEHPQSSEIYREDTDYANGVFVSGEYAYIADDDSGLAIIDISNPSNPSSPVYRDTTGDSADVFVSGNYAYVADFQSGLAVIDISEHIAPPAPTPVGGVPFGNFFLIFIGLSVIGLIITKKRKIIRKS